MFEKKSPEEFAAMSPEEQKAYLAAKEKHDKEQLEKTAKEAAEKAVEEKLKEQPESISKSDFDKFKTETTAMIENIGKAANKTEGTREIAVKALAEKYEELYEKSSSPEVQKEIEEARTKSNNAKFVIEHKAWDPAVIHTVGTTGSQPVTSTYQTIVTQVVGRFTKPRPFSSIMNLVDVQPLNTSSITIFETTTTGNFEVTPEGELKPFIKYEEKDVTADAEIVTALWCTTAKLRRFYPGVANQMRSTLETLLGETIPNKVLDYVRTNASAYTPIPALAVFTAPNEYDAIVSVIAGLKKIGYVPNGVSLSPVAYAKLITNKSAEDGHYTLQNGMSIAIVGSNIKLGNYDILVTEDPKLGDDEFTVGDLSLVKAAIDGQILYLETDGRIDGETVVKTGLAANVRTHELGKFFATVMADGAKSGIVFDTFTNVKTLITKP